MTRPLSALGRLGAGLLVALSVSPASAQDGERTLDVEPPAGAGERVALVLGNAEYAPIRPLLNAVNDAEDMASVLRDLGFTVVLERDRSRNETAAAIGEFERLAAGAEVALLFYAGHGAEVGGENYLIPVDFGQGPDDFDRPQDRAVPLRRLLDAMGGAEMQVVILDACRNDPFQGREGGGWEEPPDIAGDTFVAYGTAPGSTASDNPDGRNGLFTSALLEEIRTPGLEAAELMRRVIRRVREESQRLLAESGREHLSPQSPWSTASYVLPFYFTEPGEDGHPEVEAPPPDVERWAREGQAAYEREDYAAAEPPLRQAARAGHTESQYLLGTMYLAGRGVAEDRAQAADWFRLASLRGHPEAQHFLGGMYSGGFGVDQDDDRAADLYQRAAAQGLSVSQHRLGVVYESGRGRPRNVGEAVRWYRQAAQQGHDDARSALQRLADDGNLDARAALRLL